jgi:type IV pilus assembly protein PilM
MIKFPFGSSSKNALGIDIGTFSIKIVELSRKGERTTLENYGEVTTGQIGSSAFRSGLNQGKDSLALSNKEIAQGIQAILLESKMRSKSVTFSLPDFSSFFTSFELPPMTREELPKAINFEAKQHIPLSLSDVVLDWQVIENKNGNETNGQLPNKVILVAVPKEVIIQYQEIGRVCNLTVAALEAEVFGLIRSLIKDPQKAIILVDIGAQSTTINVVENKILRMSHSFDIGGDALTQEVVDSQGVNFWVAEEFKKQQKINPQLSPQQSASQIFISKLDLILAEIEKISQTFYQREGKEIGTVILAGGTSLFPGLKEYFVLKLNKEVIIGDPFANIFCPQILATVLKEVGPSYAIAVGMALRGLE